MEFVLNRRTIFTILHHQLDKSSHLQRKFDQTRSRGVEILLRYYRVNS